MKSKSDISISKPYKVFNKFTDFIHSKLHNFIPPNKKDERETSNSIKDNPGLRGRFQSIRVQLFIGLLIPIVFLAVYGLVSYNKTEDALIGNYEASAVDTVDAVSKYMNLGFSMIEKSSMEITLDINFRAFFNLSEADAIGNTKSYDDIIDRISLSKISNNFVSEIH